MKRKILALLLASALILVTLTACGGGSDGGSSAEGGSSAGSSTGGEKKDTIVMAIDGNPGSMHPTFLFSGTDLLMCQTLYDSLLYIPRGESEPRMMVAERYEISEDGKTYTFYLRQGVKFHNGEELKAEDVIYSFEQAAEGYGNSQWISKIVDKQIIDDYTVSITLDSVFSPFLSFLDNVYILHKETTEAAGEDFALNPVGTGPYQFVSMSNNDEVVVKAFDDYWGGKPDIENVIFKVIPEPTTNSIGLETGEIDVSYNLPINELENLEASGIEIGSIPVHCIEYVFFNHEKAPFDNVLVRQAVNYALDRVMCEAVTYEGRSQIATSMVPTVVAGYSENVAGYPFDMEKAKELMAEAGYPNGEGLDPIVITTSAGRGLTQAEILQQNLTELGFQVTIESLESAAFRTALQNGEFTIGTNSAGATSADGSGFRDFLGSNGSMNYYNFSYPEIDSLFDEAEQELDTAKRNKIYEEIWNLSNELALYAPTTYRVAIFGSNPALDMTEQYSGWSKSGYPLPQYISYKE